MKDVLREVVLAEIVAARHGREGGRLSYRNGRIHEVPA